MTKHKLSNVGLVVRLVAKSGKEEELAAFLAAAEPLARAESFTLTWFAFRAAKDVFYIVDAFADATDRQRHIDGEIAKALFAKAPDLLAEKPSIAQVDVLGEKLLGA